MSGLCCVWFLVAALNSGFCVRLLRAASTRLLRAASTCGFFVRLLHCVEFPRTHALCSCSVSTLRRVPTCPCSLLVDTGQGSISTTFIWKHPLRRTYGKAAKQRLGGRRGRRQRRSGCREGGVHRWPLCKVSSQQDRWRGRWWTGRPHSNEEAEETGAVDLTWVDLGSMQGPLRHDNGPTRGNSCAPHAALGIKGTHSAPSRLGPSVRWR